MMGINKVIRNRGMNDMPKNLTVEQKNILSSMKVGAAFAADVAHACITMYVWDDNPKFLYIYHQELPRTQFFGELPDKTGRELRGNEEPLVQQSLHVYFLSFSDTRLQHHTNQRPVDLQTVCPSSN